MPKTQYEAMPDYQTRFSYSRLPTNQQGRVVD
jgi:hypothetical protein